ncbi:MAG: thiamine phosphate synthase [Caulobacterales bacterium]
MRGKRLPRLLFFTDPWRTPHPERTIARLPRGAGVVYRPFGASGAFEKGQRLARIARRRGIVFLVGAEAGLASRLRADGVHLPERLARRAASLKRARPGWIVTCAAHSTAAIVRGRRAGADAAVVSTVFASRSASAGRPLGVIRFARMVQVARLPVYALGGVDAATARRLTGSGAAGLVAVEALVGRD